MIPRIPLSTAFDSDQLFARRDVSRSPAIITHVILSVAYNVIDLTHYVSRARIVGIFNYLFARRIITRVSLRGDNKPADAIIFFFFSLVLDKEDSRRIPD